MKTSTKVILILVAIIVIGIALASGQSARQSAVKSATVAAGKTMYFCGYDTCKDSGEYGELIFRTGISTWNNPDPNRGGLCRQASHGEIVTVVREKRVDPGAGGLWYKLSDNCWTNDLWLTAQVCTPANLEKFSTDSCW